MDKNNKKQNPLKIILENKGYFLINLFIVLTITFSILYLFDLVPNEFKSIIGRDPVKESTGGLVGELPINIKIPNIGVDAQIYNPSTTSVKVLDDFLLKGAVRYPGSGLLGGTGNIFIFGHSTGIKIVNNQAFKTFNGLKDLKEGDLIHIFSDKTEYVYKVTKVSMVGAEETMVEFNTKSKKLTISTCNTFGEKTDRYVVESEFVAKQSLTKNN
jgi:LPXTG-site transpeptidase (sortase) family protein